MQYYIFHPTRITDSRGFVEGIISQHAVFSVSTDVQLVAALFCSHGDFLVFETKDTSLNQLPPLDLPPGPSPRWPPLGPGPGA